MSVIRVEEIYTGLAADSKPTPVSEGALYVAHDTPAIFRYRTGAWAAIGNTMQVVPGPSGVASGDYVVFAKMFRDTTGTPDRYVIVTVKSTNAVALVEYKRLGNAWVHDMADCASDSTVALNFTAAAQEHITAFAVDDPAGTGDRIVFIAGNNAAGTDTFEMDSIVLIPGSTTLTAVAVVIAGAQQPTDTNLMATIGIPLSTTRVMTIYKDDGHFADVTESTGTYTFTYTDAKATAIDTSIDVDAALARRYSGVVIGSQVLILSSRGPVSLSSDVAWELTTAAALVEEFTNFRAGTMGSSQGNEAVAPAAITAIDGVFAVAGPIGGSGADGQFAAYLVSTFPLDDL